MVIRKTIKKLIKIIVIVKFIILYHILFYIYRRDSSGKELGMNPEKISVENDKSTSKLVIKNLDLFDSGTYELVADNDAHRKQITVTLLVEGN